MPIKLPVRRKNLRAYEKACPLLVPLVEEGWINHHVTDAVVRIYLGELTSDAAAAGHERRHARPWLHSLPAAAAAD